MCQISKRYGKQVQADLVHHIYPADEYPEYAYCSWNLISLSRAMHNTLHDRNTDQLTAAGKALMRKTIPPYQLGIGLGPMGTARVTFSNSEEKYK